VAWDGTRPTARATSIRPASKASTGRMRGGATVMLIMARRTRPAHERYAAAAKRVQQRITRALERGDYARVRELSELLQELVRKAAAAKRH
jgi:hypothetical protein